MGKCAKFLLIIGLCLIIQRSAQAERICSVSDYRGTYAFQGTGAFVDLPPEAAALAGPFAQAGTFTSDGHGNAFIDTVNSFNGIISPTAAGAT